jgi:polyhydroxyalkanoate synthase subunit PhaC
VINPPATNKRNHWVGGEASADQERWLATARDVPGSWWGKYGAWQQAGQKIAAPKRTGNRKYRHIEPAPGRHVMAKAE